MNYFTSLSLLRIKRATRSERYTPMVERGSLALVNTLNPKASRSLIPPPTRHSQLDWLRGPMGQFLHLRGQACSKQSFRQIIGSTQSRTPHSARTRFFTRLEAMYRTKLSMMIRQCTCHTYDPLVQGTVPSGRSEAPDIQSPTRRRCQPG